MLELIILGFSAVANIILATVVLVKNPHGRLNRYFFLFIVATVLWLVVNYISLHPLGLEQLFWIRSVLTCATLLSIFLLLTINVFPSGAPLYKRLPYIVTPSGLVIAGLTLTPAVFSDLVSSDGGSQPVIGPGMALFGPFAIGSIIFAVFMLARKYSLLEGRFKQQIKVAFFGVAVTFTLILMSNFVLVTFFNNQSLIAVAPLYLLILNSSFAYGIVKHRLFDIRTLIIRAIVYIGLLVILSITYVWTVFNIGTTFLERNGLNGYLLAFYITTTILVSMSFHRLKLFFDQLTNKVFFQDAYDTKTVLDRVTSVLVRAIAVDKLVGQSLTILSNALKSQYAVVTIGDPAQVRSPRKIAIRGELVDLKRLQEELSKHSRPLLVLDEIADQSRYLYQIMEKANVAVIARLETSKELIGYAFFGYKESGNIYNSKDIELIRIASDELAVAVQNALRFEEITRFNERLQIEVDEATKQLRESNKKLRALDEAKDEFISMASHQLRTPLTSVKGYVSMVLEGDAGALNTDQKKLLQEAYASAQRMVYMIADFLNISRLKTGKFLLEPSTVNLPELIQEEVSQLTATAKARGITITAHVPADFPALRLDETKIRQVIMNFIDNAIFYSNSGGDIVITLSESNKQVIFTVQDSGIGVPVSEQASLFTKFFRASNARQVRPDGTGIGLFMAKMVISAHGGDMIFESQENKGSIFGFTLPLTGVAVKKRFATTRLKAK